MAATYTPGSGASKDRVRLLTSDTNVSGSNALLQDEEITELLTLESDSVWLASARGLDIIATSEVLVQKKIRLLNGDIATDGPAVARALREQAKELRARAATEEGEGFEIIELNVDGHTNQELLHNEWLKGNL